MGLFRFGGTERTSGEAVARPAAPETLAVSDESVRSDGEQGEDSRIRVKVLLRRMRTLRFLVIARAGRVARIGGRNVLRLGKNPATQLLYRRIDHAPAP